MSNIHGLGDYRAANNNQQNRAQQNMNDGPGQIPDFLKSMFVNQGNRPLPRKETFMQMLHFTFCPGLTIKYFIAIISIVEVLVFLSCLTVTFVNPSYSLNSNIFLGPASQCYTWFDKNAYDEKYNYQVWRFLTPIFFHVGFSHIISNMLTQLIFGSLLEQWIGFKHIAAVYFVSGIGGNLFSSMFTDAPSVGASTADLGIYAGMLAMIFVNWN